MKIGILAVKTYNYGSLLQTYALQKYVTKLGYDNEIVNYKKNNIIKQISRLFYLPLFIDTLKQLFTNVFLINLKPEVKDYVRNRNLSFANFISGYLHESNSFVGRKALCIGVNKYDEIILGSDQLWHPFNYGAHFFDMSFVPDNIVKIAYAPSFGVSSLPNYQQKGMAKSIKRINALSVREISGQKLIKELCGREAMVVSDPTMLLSKEDWAEVKASRLIEEDYIFCYFIGNNVKHRSFVVELSKKTNLKIVSLPHIYCYQHVDQNFGDIHPKDIGPREFVSLIANAKYVCTDSFHGSVFSIIHERNFFTFPRFAETKMSANSRLYTLFEKLDIRGRFLSEDTTVEEALQLEMIDYKIVSNNLQDYRAFSQKWLKEQIINGIK